MAGQVTSLTESQVNLKDAGLSQDGRAHHRRHLDYVPRRNGMTTTRGAWLAGPPSNRRPGGTLFSLSI